jgi:O-antigen chain-terminating methyltransferase
MSADSELQGSPSAVAPVEGPSSGLIARAAAHAEPPEVRSASRLGFAGVWVRRLVRRLTRFQSLPQAEYNRAVLDALRAQEATLGALAGQIGDLSRSLEAVVSGSLPSLGHQLGELSRSLEAVVERSLPTLGHQVGDLSRSLEAVVSESVPALGDQLGALSRTVEAVVERSLPTLGEQLGNVSRTVEQMVEDGLPALGDQLGLVGKTVHELSEGFSETYNTVHAQGRHLDALAGQLGELGERTRDLDVLDARMRAHARDVSAAMEDLLARWRPNLHFDHFDFSRKHRGSEEELVRRMAKYAVLFGPVARVLDVGCGRGEFLEACREAGVGAYGIETDPDMVSRCRMKALEVHEADALEHLRGLEDRSLDGIFMAQVIEHLTASEIVDFVRLAADKLRRGATIIVETINPETFAALRWFWMDPTHRQPVSPAMLRFLLEDAGFTLRDVLLSSPVPEEETLQRLPESAVAAAGGDRDAVRAYNQNVEKLNRVLFGEQDYAIIAER